MSSIENFIGVNLRDDAVNPVLARTVLAMYRELIKEGALDIFSGFMSEFSAHEIDYNNPHRVTVAQLGDLTAYLYQAYTSTIPSGETPLTKDDFVTEILGQEDVAMEFLCRLILNDKNYSIENGTGAAPVYTVDTETLLAVEPITRKFPIFATTPTATNCIDYLIANKTLPYPIDLSSLPGSSYSGVIKAKLVDNPTGTQSITLKTADYTVTFSLSGPATDPSIPNLKVSVLTNAGTNLIIAGTSYTLPDGTQLSAVTKSTDSVGNLSFYCKDSCFSFSLQDNVLSLYLTSSQNAGSDTAPSYEEVGSVTIAIPLTIAASASNSITTVTMNIAPISSNDLLTSGIYLDTFLLYGEALPLEYLNFYNYAL